MSELIIKLTGEVTDTNFDEWKSELLARLKSVNTELSSDDDFANAETDVKTIKAGEKALKDAKTSALEQANEIQKLFAAIDEVSEEARDARLALERQIKKRKTEIKEEIVDSGVTAIKEYLEQQSTALQSLRNSWADKSAFEDAIKGKRTTDSMQKAVTKLLVQTKNEIADREEQINRNYQKIEKIDDEYSAVFQDQDSLALMNAEQLDSTIEERIEFFEAEKKKQAETAPPATELAPEAEAALPVSEAQAPDAEETIHPADESHVISIEVFAQIDAAQELYDEIDDRYSNREIIGEIKLS